MAEELRFFLRVGVFAAIVGVVYWFVSYEIAGTVLLVSLAVGAAIFTVTMGTVVSAARKVASSAPEGGSRGPLGFLDRLLGFEEHSEPARSQPFEVQEDPVARSSAWPLAAALAGMLVAVGLVFGPWFWIPGVALALATAWGWLTELG